MQGMRDLQPERELTMCFVQPSDNEENKHDEVAF